MSPRTEGHASVAITANRGLPIPTKDNFAPYSRPPIEPRSGHVPIKCGTPRGYWRHRQLGIKPCPECLKAVEAKVVVPPKPKRRAPMEHGTPRGAWRHKKRGEDVCDACRDAYNADRREKRRNKQPGPTGGPTFDVRAAQADRDAGMTALDAATKYGVSKQSIWRWTTGPHGKRPMAPYKRIDIARLRELWEQGMNDPQIAAVLGVDPSAVGQRRRALKLKAHGRRAA